MCLPCLFDPDRPRFAHGLFLQGQHQGACSLTWPSSRRGLPLHRSSAVRTTARRSHLPLLDQVATLVHLGHSGQLLFGLFHVRLHSLFHRARSWRLPLHPLLPPRPFLPPPLQHVPGLGFFGRSWLLSYVPAPAASPASPPSFSSDQDQED